MARKTILFVLVITAFFCMVQSASAEGHRLGAGIHYWYAIDDIDTDNVDENGYAFLISYQYKPTIMGFEFDLELADKELTGKSKMEYSPQAYVLFGGFIYAGLGIGTHYYDGEFTNPFYALKAGFDLELFPHLHLDINGNYRFDNWDYDEVSEDIDTDTVTLGAVVRIEF